MQLRTVMMAGAILFVLNNANAQTPEEAEVIEKGFAAMDLDGDGTITKKEFSEYMTGYLAQQRREFDAFFEDLDANKDGKISKEEAAGNSALEVYFDQIDEDGDGFITKDDVRAAMKAAQESTVKQ